MKPMLLTSLLFLACATPSGWLPARSEPLADGELTLVWVGHGECERFEDGAWVRHPENDYEFSVEQHRFADHWESVKSLRRLHPAYDGIAGPRLQTYFFRIGLEPGEGLSLTSTLGNGSGHADREFREAELQFEAAGVSSMAPFDRYRITQHYDYEGGALTELVELTKGPQPWVRNRETAKVFGARAFDAAPTHR